MSNIVEINNLTKKYANKTALDNVNLNIERGKVVGILGPNGSGKTTLIKILTGLLRQTSGEVLIDGNKVGVKTKSAVSYLPDRNFLYKWMRIEDACHMYKDFYTDFDEAKFNELLAFMNLNRSMKIDSLSKGMHEKLNLALVLSRNAKLYILDEPIAGVDPVARDQILDAIINNYNEDSSMIITTHLVRDMESMFDEVVFLKDGQIVLTGNAEALREEKAKQIEEIYKEIFGEG
ncbi:MULTISPECIES: ABC transporter ATP-binding protein [Bacillaceae]|jgi:ABC-2 type transport system ATP-binding protein|uniref:ABC transporter-like protein n=1 Tax=Caldibacillus thermoamylovorans TaxID=35841 RepID=A0A090IWE8_9BACI|nr:MULTISPECIES: ABC transporter ATP-binding protein [Bacillaceae]NWN97126.1 ABC transporter ATP-binding protein [Bacillus sp. (in: firmicutes)]MBU5341031.1 ABC transporter ATP-binding protein [Caldifermentibacillus hisashii]MCB7070371.1 ABC transporter ATP-binding protein [Caldibacillus sp. 210928-DFI.2.22]MCB7072159.1 ABC transporter ATP-binding protein [Caldibacillus sp. 210928-DFI.2.18]MEC5273898.1 ABC transporter ATP-binding protein [Caldifermentibacillus hisashii]